MKPAALLLLAALCVLGCGGYGIDAINCYAPQAIPDGALLFDCYVECVCDGGYPHHETVAAFDKGAALTCWETYLTSTNEIATASTFGCVFQAVYHTDPGGKPSSYRGGEI